MAWLDMTWAMAMTAIHIYIMAFILLINIMRRFHGLYAHLRMARFHALIQMGGTHLHCVQRTVSFSKDGESLTSKIWTSFKKDIVFCTQEAGTTREYSALRPAGRERRSQRPKSP